jgi:[acyl-carrier-protein] S-malonyltransferase
MESDFRTGDAFVFPGMGPSRFADVAKFMVINPYARNLVAAADKRLGYSLIERFRTAEGDYSEYAQVAFLVNSVALAQWAEEALEVEPDVCVGPSFGGKAAAVHSGALDFSDAVWMTAQLARCMDEYFAVEHTDVVTHSFVRCPVEELRAIQSELDAEGEWHEVACYIDDDFYMMSLREGRLDWLQQRLRAVGGMPLYTMRPPMHSRVFEGLRRKVDDEVLSQLEFRDPELPVVADQDGALLVSAEGVRTMLLDGFTRAVRWPAVVEALKGLDVRTLYVAGQDGLFGRVRRTTANFRVVRVNAGMAMQPRRRRPAAA